MTLYQKLQQATSEEDVKELQFNSLVEGAVKKRADESKEFLQEHLRSLRLRADISKDLLSQTDEFYLKHLDIMLEATKNFLVIFSTMFIGLLAVDPKYISNINIDTARYISLIAVIISILSFVLLLVSRKRAVRTITDRYSKLLEIQQDAGKIETEIINISSFESITKAVEQVKEFLKKEHRDIVP